MPPGMWRLPAVGCRGCMSAPLRDSPCPASRLTWRPAVPAQLLRHWHHVTAAHVRLYAQPMPAGFFRAPGLPANRCCSLRSTVICSCAPRTTASSAVFYKCGEYYWASTIWALGGSLRGSSFRAWEAASVRGRQLPESDKLLRDAALATEWACRRPAAKMDSRKQL